jgi:ABC-type nitrate/sulfonate/bicarbonate transport system substrate-binding protein
MKLFKTVLAAGALMLAGTALQAGEIRVLAFGGATNLPIWIAQEKGLLEKEGVKLTLAFTNGSVPQFRDYYAGKYDVISTALDNIVAYGEGQSDVPLPGPYDMFAFAGIHGGMNSLMVRPEIKTYADIKGKSVAVDALKSGYGIVLYQILKDKGGLEFDRDYKAISVGNTDKRVEAMKDNKAVAAIIGSPNDMAVERDGFKLMADAAQELGAYQGSVLVTRRGFAQTNEADLVALTRAMMAAHDLIFTDKALALSVMKKNLKGMTDADAEKLYQRMTSPGGFTRRAEMDMKGVATVLRIRETYGEPQKKMGPASRYVDLAIYEKALGKK